MIDSSIRFLRERVLSEEKERDVGGSYVHCIRIPHRLIHPFTSELA